MNKVVSAYSETYVIPIRVVSGFPEIINLSAGLREKIIVGYYYILDTDVFVSREVDFLVIGDGPKELS